MKRQPDIAARFKAGDDHNDRINATTRQFVQALVYESESGRGDMTVDELLDAVANGREARRAPDSEIEAVARDAEAEYEQHADDIESGRMSHISEPTREGALNKLARDVSRQRSYDSDDAEPMSGDDLLEALVQAVRDRQAGK